MLTVRGSKLSHVLDNKADKILIIADSTVDAERNVIDPDRISPNAKHSYNGGMLRVRAASNSVVESNTGGFVGFYSDSDTKLILNDASSDYFEYDAQVDVEYNKGAAWRAQVSAMSDCGTARPPHGRRATCRRAAAPCRRRALRWPARPFTPLADPATLHRLRS